MGEALTPMYEEYHRLLKGDRKAAAEFKQNIIKPLETLAIKVSSPESYQSKDRVVIPEQNAPAECRNLVTGVEQYAKDLKEVGGPDMLNLAEQIKASVQKLDQMENIAKETTSVTHDIQAQI